MSKIGEKALTKLLSRAEKKRLSQNQVTLKFTNASFPDYSKISDKEELNEVHSYLENAQRHQAIIIGWQANQKGVQIDKVCLGAVNKLAFYLGVATLSERIKHANEQLSTVLSDAPAWLSTLYEEVIRNKWEQSKKMFGLAPEDSQVLGDVIKLISYLEQYGTNDLDRRSLSTRIFHDSKYIEKSLQSKLVQIYRHRLNDPDLLADEILAGVGIFRHPLPMLIKGNLTFVTKNQNIEVNNISPYLGIPPDSIEDVVISQPPAYCLTIENLSSFNAYTRTISDGGIILYTNGFPGSNWQKSYKRILHALPKSIKVFHWGDIDVGGFRILQKLQEYASQVAPCLRVSPHLMGDGDILLRNKYYTSAEQKYLESIIKHRLNIENCLGKIPEHKQEQEALIPNSPLEAIQQ